MHGHDVVVLRKIGHSSKRTEVAELEHTLSDDLKNDSLVLVRPALPLADPHDWAAMYDLIVVRTPDALLICHRHDAEKIKDLVGKLPPELQ